MPNLTKWLVKAISGYANIVDAAEKGNLEAVQSLIAAGYNVNRRRDKDGDTALLAALNGSHFEIVSYLLTLQEIDVNQSNNKGITPLLLAVEKENISIVSYLLTLPEINVNQSSKKGITPLFLAIEEANFEIVKLLLLRDDIVVKKQVGWGYSPICLAVEKNLVEILTLLVNKPGADLNEPGFKGDTPLIMALNSHNMLNWIFADADQSILRILLDAGADVNKEGYRNLCPMYYVIEKELNDVFELLIKCDNNKLEINKLFVSGHEHFDTALTFAIKKRNLRLAESLISHDADQGITDNKGMTPLMLAIDRDYTDFAVELIQKATTETINKKNDKGDTALTLAIEQGNLRLAESLISHDADQGITDKKGMTPLMLAIREGHDDIALKLIETATPETLNKTNPDGDTALTLAIEQGNLRLAESLISHEADQGISDAQGMTALMLAIREGHDDIALKLIETATTETLNNISFEGYTAMTLACSENNESVLSALLQRADLELNPSNCEYTPLLHASLHKNEALVNALVKKGASVNHTNKDGVTALLVAVENDDFKLVELLITLNADVDKVRFSDGKTPLIVAIEKGNLELASKLVECNANVNHIAVSGISPLRLAFKNGQVDFVRKLLAHGADESLVSDMIEYKKYKKIEGLIQYIEDNSANEITCPISFGSLAVDGYVVSDNERSPAFSSGVGNGIYSENNLRRWLSSSSSFNDPLTRDNISSNTLIDISRDIAAYFDPLITKMITEISDLPNEEKIALGLTELTQGSDQLLLSYSDALYAKLSKLPVHEFTTLRSKLVNLNKEHVQELGIVQQRSQSFDQNIPIMADTASYAEVKGYNPSGMDAEHKEMLGTKAEDMQVPRHKILSRGLSEGNTKSQSKVQTVESARSAEEQEGIER